MFTSTATAIRPKDSSLNRVLLILSSLLAFAPTITALLSWDLDGKLDEFQYALRHHGFVVVCLEIGFIINAIWHGMRPRHLLQSLARWQRLALSLVAVPAFLSATLAVFATQEVWLATTVWVIHGLFFSSVIFLYGSDYFWRTGLFWKLFLLGTLSYIALVILFAHIVPNTLTFPWKLRMPGVTNVRHTGYFVAPAMAVATAYFFLSEEAVSRIASLATLAILGCFAFWSGSRGIFFALAFTGVASLLIYSKFRSIKKCTTVLVVILCGALVSMIFEPPAQDFGILNRVNQVTSRANPDITTGRTTLWLKTLSTIKHSPMIGYGAGKFRDVMHSKAGSFNHPHNLVLQIVFQWGLIGAAGFFLILISVCRLCFKQARAYKNSAPAFGVLVTLLSYSMIDGTGHYPFPISLALVAAGLLLTERSEPITAPAARRTTPDLPNPSHT